MPDDYDTRLDSSDRCNRQQAELEALRTAYMACRSDSDGEMDSIRAKLSSMTNSYEGQKRNTIAFHLELVAERKLNSALLMAIEQHKMDMKSKVFSDDINFINNKLWNVL